MENSRPKLTAWTHLKSGDIKKFDIRLLNCEIYELDNTQFAYLFLDLEIENIHEEKLKNITYEILDYEFNKYIVVINNERDVDFISKIKKLLTSNIWFEAIAGMDNLKSLFSTQIVEPLRNPEKYKKYKLTIPNWVLFFWPPWCGKTYMSRQLADEIWYNFYEVKHSDIASPYIHWSTWKIWEVFREAKSNSPSIVFFDEISSLVPKREWLWSNSEYREEEVWEFLMQLWDASKNSILVIAATNFPDRIDTAIMRSGRMDKRIYIGPPDYKARLALFKMYLAWRPTEDIDYEKLAEVTEVFVNKSIVKRTKIGFTADNEEAYVGQKYYYVASDIELLADNFARKWLELSQSITMDICLDILDNFLPSLSEEQLEYYASFTESYQRL